MNTPQPRRPVPQRTAEGAPLPAASASMPPRRRRWPWWLGGSLATLLLLYALGGFLLLPWLLQRELPPLLEQRLGLTLSLGALRINPFLLRAEADEVTLTQPDGNRLLETGHARVDMDWSGLFARRWTVAEATLESPRLTLVREPDGSFSLPKLASAGQDAPPRQQASGSVAPADGRAVEPGMPAGKTPDGTSSTPSGQAAESTASTEPFQTPAHPPTQPTQPTDTSTPPDDEPALPPLQIRHLALTDGSILIREREATADTAPIAIEGIDLRADDLASAPEASAAAYQLGARLPGGGTLQAEGDIALAGRSSQGRIHIADTRLESWWPLLARDWDLAPPQGRVTLGGRYKAGVAASGFDLLVEELSLAADELHLARAGKRGKDAPMLALLRAEIGGGSFALGDRRLSLQGLRLSDGEVSVIVDAEGKLDWASLHRGTDTPPAADEAPWRIELPEARLENVALHYLEQADARRRLDVARVDAGGTLTIATGDEGLRVDALNATLQRPRFAGGDASPLTVERIALAGASVDTARRALTARELALSGSRVDLAIEPDGTVFIPGGLVPQAAREGKQAPPAQGQQANAAQPWSYAIDTLRADGLDLGFHDKRTNTPLQLRVQGSVQLTKVASGQAGPMGVDIKLNAASGGRLQMQGESAQDVSRLQGRMRLEAVDLAPARALVERYTTLKLLAGKIGGDLQVRYARDGQPRLRVEGEARLDGIRFDVAESGEPLFSAHSINTRGSLQLGPDRLALGSIVMDQPNARLIVDNDRQLNLAKILRQRDNPAADGGAQAVTKNTAREVAEKVAEDAPDRFPLRVDRIELRNATMDFADQSLILPFSAQAQGLNGQVLGVDNAAGSEAVVDARGAIPPYGEVRVEGRLRPFAPNELTDVAVRFDNVEMSQLSPYSATFAGRTIARGRLWLDVRYRVFDWQLDGNNAVTLEDFTLGERVDAPNSMDLPLELALALLKDQKGRVHLEVPVRGNVGDARFEYGQLVRDAIANVLKRAVTAPFRLLARLVGRGDDDSLQAVAFETGSDRLSPVEEEKLQQLATALAQRPQLKLRLRGTYLNAQDGAALRLQATRREVATAAGQSPGPGPVNQLDFSDSAIRSAIASRFEATAGPQALTAFRDEFARSPQAGNETTLHRELFNRLLQHQALPDEELQMLAEHRGKAVHDYLAAHGVAGERLESKTAGAAEGRKTAPQVELEVGLGR